jgi:hypothetical protein
MTTKKTSKANQALVAALSLLGASLGVGMDAAQAAHYGTSTQIKGETKGTVPSAMFLKYGGNASHQIKGEHYSNQHKLFWTGTSNQWKGHSNQLKDYRYNNIQR